MTCFLNAIRKHSRKRESYVEIGNIRKGKVIWRYEILNVFLMADNNILKIGSAKEKEYGKKKSQT